MENPWTPSVTATTNALEAKANPFKGNTRVQVPSLPSRVIYRTRYLPCWGGFLHVESSADQDHISQTHSAVHSTWGSSRCPTGSTLLTAGPASGVLPPQQLSFW